MISKQKHMKFIFLIFVCTCLCSVGVGASDYKVYVIDSLFEAVSSGNLTLDLESKDMKGYSSEDESTGVTMSYSYVTATPLRGVQAIRKYLDDVILSDEHMAIGQVLTDKVILHKEHGYINNNPGVYYTLKYKLLGYDVYKYDATFYHDARIYSWAVYHIDGVTKVSGSDVFNRYVKYFKLTKK